MTNPFLIYINGELTVEVVNKFINDVNNFKDEKLHIYINSIGGEISHAEVIKDIISNLEDVTLIASGDLFSAAFDIFFMSKCKEKIILPKTYGMVHYTSILVEIDESLSPRAEQPKFILNEFKKHKKETINILKKIGLTKKELSIIKKGKDCYFDTKRLIELLRQWERK